MKKLRLAGFLLLAPLTFLTACSSATPTLSFNANWYRNTALKSRVENTFERLEYEVTFEAVKTNGFSLNYSNGVYTTELKNDRIQLDNGVQSGYVYTTELKISVSYSLSGETKEFEDTVQTRVEFLSAAEGLKPVRSFREVHSHAPVSATPDSLESAYFDYAYTYATEYDDALTKAETTHIDLNTLKKTERSYDVKGNGVFLDNEQILFALRGLDLTAGGSFRSINSVTGTVQNVTLANISTVTEKVHFEADGETVEKELAAVSVEVGYTGDNNGQPQTAIFAATTDPSANLYRNVPLRVEVPIVHSLGVLRYKLIKATFASNSN